MGGPEGDVLDENDIIPPPCRRCSGTEGYLWSQGYMGGGKSGRVRETCSLWVLTNRLLTQSKDNPLQGFYGVLNIYGVLSTCKAFYMDHLIAFSQYS